MTLVLSWLARDHRKVSAVYIASDSRISWDLQSYIKGQQLSPLVWDTARKLFIFRNYPDIIAYCGDVLFPMQVITQAIDIFDLQINDKILDFSERVTQFIKLLKQQLTQYPLSMIGQFEILMAGRFIDSYQFGRYHLSWNSNVFKERYLLDNTSLFETAIILGSGKRSFETFYVAKYKKSDMHNFSRAGFSALSDYLKSSNKEIHCGGSTQLVTIYNQGQPKIIGTIYNGERYILGAKINDSGISQLFEWRDEIFQRTQPDTIELLENAQRHGKNVKL